MSDSLAARLEEPVFMMVFDCLFEKFTAEQIVTLMSDRLATKLEQSEFTETFNCLFDKFNVKQIVTPMSDAWVPLPRVLPQPFCV